MRNIKNFIENTPIRCILGINKTIIYRIKISIQIIYEGKTNDRLANKINTKGELEEVQSSLLERLCSKL